MHTLELLWASLVSSYHSFSIGNPEPPQGLWMWGSFRGQMQVSTNLTPKETGTNHTTGWVGHYGSEVGSLIVDLKQIIKKLSYITYLLALYFMAASEGKYLVRHINLQIIIILVILGVLHSNVEESSFKRRSIKNMNVYHPHLAGYCITLFLCIQVTVKSTVFL